MRGAFSECLCTHRGETQRRYGWRRHHYTFSLLRMGFIAGAVRSRIQNFVPRGSAEVWRLQLRCTPHGFVRRRTYEALDRLKKNTP